jgi:hypothetical protein
MIVGFTVDAGSAAPVTSSEYSVSGTEPTKPGNVRITRNWFGLAPPAPSNPLNFEISIYKSPISI